MADDAFAVLGLERRFAQDEAAIVLAHRNRLTRCHPDRVSAQGSAALSSALREVAAVNGALFTLGDPLRRLAYLLSLRGPEMGFDVGLERGFGMGFDVGFEIGHRVPVSSAARLDRAALDDALSELSGNDCSVERADLCRDLEREIDAMVALLGAELDAAESPQVSSSPSTMRLAFLPALAHLHGLVTLLRGNET